MRITSPLATVVVLAAGAHPALAAGAHPALAAGPPSVRFQHHDWELDCDNTRTCRAAGYHAEDGRNAPVTVLLERRAGPGTTIAAHLRLGERDDGSGTPASVAMTVDGRALGDIGIAAGEGRGALTPVQSAALLRAVASAGQVAWHAEGRSWTLSGKGAAAVLLKMDEFQGRLNTQGAAIRKGAKADSGVPPALPAPVVVAARVPATAPPMLNQDDERLLLATLRKTAGNGDCADLVAVAGGENAFAYAPLTNGKMLVSARCWRGAYNEGHGYWIANRRAPFSPVLVTASGTGYDAGTITAAHRGRGIGDCGGLDEWVWDGRRFVHTASSTTGMCRNIAAGGAWALPTLVSEVR